MYLFAVDENTEESLASHVFIWGVYVTRRRVLSVLCVLMLSRYLRGQTVEGFPVASEQNSQTEFSDNVLWVSDADRLHVNSEGVFCMIGLVTCNS